VKQKQSEFIKKSALSVMLVLLKFGTAKLQTIAFFVNTELKVFQTYKINFENFELVPSTAVSFRGK